MKETRLKSSIHGYVHKESLLTPQYSAPTSVWSSNRAICVIPGSHIVFLIYADYSHIYWSSVKLVSISSK